MVVHGTIRLLELEPPPLILYLFLLTSLYFVGCGKPHPDVERILLAYAVF